MTSTPLAERQQWPKLSQTLRATRAPDACQSCGRSKEGADTPLTFERWEECDEWDKPTGVLVVVCSPCAKKLIEKHPRLYGFVDPWQPWPGAMALCIPCKHRNGLSCTHPQLAKNGGPGLKIIFPKPDHAILCGHGCRYASIYHGPPKSCAGREVLT